MFSVKRVDFTQEGVIKTLQRFSSFSFCPHLLPAVLTTIFIAVRVRASLSLVNVEAEVCLLRIFPAFRFQLQICNFFAPEGLKTHEFAARKF